VTRDCLQVRGTKRQTLIHTLVDVYTLASDILHTLRPPSVRKYSLHVTMSRTSSTERPANSRQHNRAIFSLELFDSFGEARAFERRGGIAGRGHGSFPASPQSHSRESSEEANDSGYFSNIIHEEDEATDADDALLSPPLSPKTKVPPRVRTKQRTQRKRRPSGERPSLKRKPSWRPNLKHDSIFEHSLHSHTRSDSIDSLIAKDVWHKSDSHLNNMAHSATASEPTLPTHTRGRPEQRRQSTLLHPSSPTIEAVSFQTVQSLPRARVVHIHRPSTSRSATPPTLISTPPPTNEPISARRPTMPPRKDSSLLHPSCPTSETSISSRLKTVISVPPDTLRTSASTPPRPKPAADPPTNTQPTERQRQISIIHSCLSESEDEEPGSYPASFDGNGRSAMESGAVSFRSHLAETAEDAVLARIDRKARVGRKRRTV
jgi:hypothetical protein